MGPGIPLDFTRTRNLLEDDGRPEPDRPRARARHPTGVAGSRASRGTSHRSPGARRLRCRRGRAAGPADDPEVDVPKDLLTAAWKLLLLRGVIGIVLGIILVAWPQATIAVLMVLVGIWALIDGIGLAAQVFDKGAGTGQRVLFGVMALVAPASSPWWRSSTPDTGRERDHLAGRHLAARAWSRSSWSAPSPPTVATPRWLLVLGALLDLVLGWLFVDPPEAQSAKGVRGRHRHPRHRLGRGLRRARPSRPAAPARHLPDDGQRLAARLDPPPTASA